MKSRSSLLLGISNFQCYLVVSFGIYTILKKNKILHTSLLGFLYPKLTLDWIFMI